MSALLAFVTSTACGGPTKAAPDASASGPACDPPDAQVVSASSLPAGNVPPCGPGYAHPNVCCLAAQGQPTACIESLETPFRPCLCGALTFPDRSTCCSLADAGDCSAATGSMDAGTGPGSGTNAGCSYPCGPGAWFAPLDGAASPCTDLPGVATDSGGMVPDGSCLYCCAGVVCVTDLTSCGDQPPCGITDACGACAGAFNHIPGIPDLCCRADGGPTDQCFSQATQIDQPF